MKSNKTLQTKEFHEFWRWFRENAEDIAARPTNAPMVDELDLRVRELNPNLSWEIGPGLSKPWQLVISPDLNRRLRNLARAIISHAPLLDGWEFHSARQPKDWNYSFQLGSANDGRRRTLNAADWTFVLLEYPDGIHEILLKANRPPTLTEDERSEAAAIVLESILGEDLLLDAVDEFELVGELEPRFAEKQRPIQELYSAVTGSGDRSPQRRTINRSIN